MKLTEEQINKYSELFHQPTKVVVAIAAMYDNLKEVEENLYLLGEEHLPEDDVDETEQEDVEELDEKIQGILPLIKETIAQELGIDNKEFEGKIKAFKINKDIYNHACPFTKEQRDNIDCDFCPLHMKNFVPLSFEFASDANISIEDAVERFKLMIYRNTDEAYQQILKNKENDTK